MWSLNFPNTGVILSSCRKFMLETRVNHVVSVFCGICNYLLILNRLPMSLVQRFLFANSIFFLFSHKWVEGIFFAFVSPNALVSVFELLLFSEESNGMSLNGGNLGMRNRKCFIVVIV